LTGRTDPAARQRTGEVLALFGGRVVLGRPIVSVIWLLGLFLGEGEWPELLAAADSGKFLLLL